MKCKNKDKTTNKYCEGTIKGKNQYAEGKVVRDRCFFAITQKKKIIRNKKLKEKREKR